MRATTRRHEHRPKARHKTCTTMESNYEQHQHDKYSSESMARTYTKTTHMED